MTRTAALIATVLLAAAPASAATHHKASKHHRVNRHKCPRGFVRKVTRRHHHKVYRCVRRHPATGPQSQLFPNHSGRAHLDPSFTQSHSDPFDVTYAYAANAPDPTQPLPDGVLDLYSDGLLECSIPVGGSTTGGSCEVHYSMLGQHQVQVTYSSGTNSNTETDIENIPAFVTSTTPAVAVTHYASGPYGANDQYSSSAQVSDQYGNTLSTQRVSFSVIDATTDTVVVPGPHAQQFNVAESGSNYEVTYYDDSRTTSYTISVPQSDTLSVVASYPGQNGWDGSQGTLRVR